MRSMSPANLEKHVLVIARIAGHEQALELTLGGVELALHAGTLLFPERAHGRIAVRAHVLGGGQIALQSAKGPEMLGERLEARILHRQVPELLRAPGGVRIGEQAADLLEAIDRP